LNEDVVQRPMWPSIEQTLAAKVKPE